MNRQRKTLEVAESSAGLPLLEPLCGLQRRLCAQPSALFAILLSLACRCLDPAPPAALELCKCKQQSCCARIQGRQLLPLLRPPHCDTVDCRRELARFYKVVFSFPFGCKLRRGRCSMYEIGGRQQQQWLCWPVCVCVCGGRQGMLARDSWGLAKKHRVVGYIIRYRGDWSSSFSRLGCLKNSLSRNMKAGAHTETRARTHEFRRAR